MRGLRTDTLGWGVSLYCLVIGTLMLITPHQFGSRTFLPLQPALPWAGAGLLLSGAALLMAVVLAPPPWARAAAYVAVAGGLLTFAVTFVSTGAWTGLSSYLVLGLGTLAAAGASLRPQPMGAGRDLFALTMGLAGALTGLVLLALPGQFQSASYDLARPWLALNGVAFIGGGGFLALAWLRWPERARLLRLAHALAGGAFLAFCLTFAIPTRGLPPLALYGGLGAYLALLPYLGPQLRRISPTSLQTRLTLALMVLAAAPLLSATAIITAQEERQATELALERQRALAATLATSTREYVSFHQAAVTALAADLAARPAGAAQAAPLLNLDQAFPSILRLAVYDAEGDPVASSDGSTLSVGVRGLWLYEQVRRTGSAMEVRTSRTLGLPVLAVGAAISGAPGRFDGLVVAAVATEDLGAKLAHTAALSSDEVYLVDGDGRVIAHPNPELAATFADRSTLAPVAALLASGQAGGVSYPTSEGAQLAGYAPIPVLGWGVVVDRQAAAVLSGVRGGREAALGVLVVVLGLASLVSVLLSRLLTVPLAALARTTRLLAAGVQAAPLPPSQIEEVAGLARALDALRDDLARRTAERDGAEARLRLLADASGALSASLDEGATLAGLVELLVPATADWCGVLLANERGELALAAAAATGGLRDGPQADQVTREAARQAARVTATGQTALVGPDERAEGPSTLVAAPLLIDTRRLGALVMARAGGREAYSEDDRALAGELARRVAVALAHTRLYAQEQQARSEAEAAVQVRDRFLATAAHELKTPLTPLIGQAQLLLRRREQGGSDPARDQRSLEVIVGQAHRLNRLVTTLLDLERLRTGRIELALASVDLAALVERLAGELRPTLAIHTLVVEASSEPALVCGDELRLEQALLNLLQNALKYSPDGGVVTIRLVAADGQLGVEVADQGVGIPEAELPRVFNPFYRSAAAERGAVPGLGVGLALIKEIATLHGGRVGVVSAEGVGSVFTLWLPAARPSERVVGGEPGALPAAAPARVSSDPGP